MLFTKANQTFKYYTEHMQLVDVSKIAYQGNNKGESDNLHNAFLCLVKSFGSVGSRGQKCKAPAYQTVNNNDRKNPQ
eukprot:m.49488 g.49488  ORF g.49488 m.49488 type:complete len:77 (+) comp10866_c0_seq2:434-664(+)